MKNLLITGFDPFGGEVVNPSWELARSLNGEVIAGARVVAVALPCVFGESLQRLDEALHRVKPVMTLAIGHLFYGLQHRLKGLGVRSGFMHIPYLPEQAARHPGSPSLPLATLVAATRLAIELAVTAEEIRAGGGQLD